MIRFDQILGPNVGILTKNSSEKSNAPHMPGVPSLGLNRCINASLQSLCNGLRARARERTSLCFEKYCLHWIRTILCEIRTQSKVLGDVC